jgi:hypothetical protein
MNLRTLCSGLLVGTFGVSSPAWARPDETRGFPLGEKSRIHTSLDLGVGYDSNPDSRDAASTVDDWKAHFLPALEIDVPGTSISFNSRAQLTVQQTFGTNAGGPAQTLFGGSLSLGLTAGGSDSVVGFEVQESLIRTPTFAGQVDVGSIGADEASLVQWYNRGDANLVLRPGGGALEFRLGYGNELRIFDLSSEAQKHQAQFEAKLRFLPKTAVVFRADFGFYSEVGYTEPGQASSDDPVYRGNPYNISIGLLGQVTTAISAIARVGFGDTLAYAADEDFFGASNEGSIRSVIANLRLQYTFGNGSNFALGYDRAMKNAIAVGGGYASDAPYAKVEILVGDRFTFGALGRLDFRTFGGTSDATSTVISADVRADYWFFDFLRGGVAYQLLSTSGEGNVPGSGVGSVPVLAPLREAVRHQILLTTGLYY